MKIYKLLNVPEFTDLLSTVNGNPALATGSVTPKGFSKVKKHALIFVNSVINYSLPIEEISYNVNCQADTEKSALQLSNKVVELVHRFTTTENNLRCEVLPVLFFENEGSPFLSQVIVKTYTKK